MLFNFTLFGLHPYDTTSGMIVDIGWTMNNWYSIIPKLVNDKDSGILKTWPEVFQRTQYVRVTFPDVQANLVHSA